MGSIKKKSAALRQSAGGVIYDPIRRRVLLIKSAEDGSWMLPRGRKKAGEKLSHTARREGREETGVTARVEGKLHVQQAKRVERHYFLMCKTKQRNEFDRHETARVKWFDPARALDKARRRCDRLVLSAALRRLGWS